MRRLLRILMNAATVLSLVLCLATAGLWVRSYWERDVRSLDRSSATSWFIISDRGTVRLAVQEITSHNPERWEVDAGEYGKLRMWIHRPESEGYAACEAGDPGVRAMHGIRGIGWFDDRDELRRFDDSDPVFTFVHRGIEISYGVLTFVFAFGPASWTIRRIRNRKRLPNRCLSCGYDLRATPQGGRCPECGKVRAERA